MARYYHPTHGVFLSMDPDPGDDDDILTQNGYTYANNNPVMMVDPDGKWFWFAVNAGFAAYDGYKAYKTGKGWKYVAKKTARGAIGGGKIKLVRNTGKYIYKINRKYTKSNLKLGRKMHKSYMANKVQKGVREKEFRLPSGKRIDFIDFKKKTIYEYKPYNPRAIKQGRKQLRTYKKEVEKIYGKGWRTRLHVY